MRRGIFIRLLAMRRTGAQKTGSFLKDYRFLASCNSIGKRKQHLQRCKNLPGLIHNIQGACGKLAKSAKFFKSHAKHNQLRRVHKSRNLARRLTLTGDNWLKSVFKFIAKHPEVVTVPVSLI